MNGLDVILRRGGDLEGGRQARTGGPLGRAKAEARRAADGLQIRAEAMGGGGGMGQPSCALLTALMAHGPAGSTQHPRGAGCCLKN